MPWFAVTRSFPYLLHSLQYTVSLSHCFKILYQKPQACLSWWQMCIKISNVYWLFIDESKISWYHQFIGYLLRNVRYRSTINFLTKSRGSQFWLRNTAFPRRYLGVRKWRIFVRKVFWIETPYNQIWILIFKAVFQTL